MVMSFLNKVLRMFRVVINSFTFIIMLIVAYALWHVNPFLSILMLAASLDQLEDVYYYMYGRRLFPYWFMPFDMIFETIAFLIGLGLFIFSLIYYTFFATWFFKAMLFISFMVMYSSIEDMATWVKSFKSQTKSNVSHEVREEEKKTMFVKHV